MTLRSLSKLADAENVTVDDLTGEVRAVAPNGRPIPVIDYVAAGGWHATALPDSQPDGFGTLFTERSVSAHAFALTVEGHSMEPEFRDGDEIIVDPDLAPRPGDFVVAKRDADAAATFKKFRSRGNDRKRTPIIELVPLNEDYPSLRIAGDAPGRIIGTVVEHRRYLR